ncbi:MAG: endo-1,4-beta-xylanase [Phycisphaerae bacterium]|nr:endo-1,4-beta-xylanase [Phycisphaerae bacterium]
MKRRWNCRRAVVLAATCCSCSALYGQEQGKAPDVYRALWNDPRVANRISDGIEKHRKGDAVIVVTGADGKPVAGAEVEAKQLTHDFLFGCNCFFLGHFKEPAKNAEYEQRFAQVFNFASAPFYWSDLEPQQGHPRFAKDSPFVYRRPPPDLCVEFAREYGLTLKGHPLMWDHFAPKWLPKDKDQVASLISARMAEIARRCADKIKIWDVVNETIVGKRACVVPDDYVAWCFKEADRRFRPDNVLLSNETLSVSHRYVGPDGRQSPYYRMLKDLIGRGVRVDGIGMQFHIADTRDVLAGKAHTPEHLFKVYDLYREFDRPLYITEMSIGTAGKGAEGQPVQAEITRNSYRLFFSIEHMAGVTWWNLGDGMAHKWQGGTDENRWQAGLLDEGLRPKQAYHVLDRLINHEWKTRVVGRTDVRGEFTFRGFHGTYEVKVGSGKRTNTFTIGVSKERAARYELRVKD